MNNYLKNQIRRANISPLKKAYGLLMGVLCPRRVERAWRKHATEMQNQLDSEHNGNCASWSYLDLHPSRCRSAFPSAL